MASSTVDKPKPPYDQRIANEAQAADQCMKLGAVLLSTKKPTGFDRGT